MRTRRARTPNSDPIETRLLIVAEMLDQAVSELTHVIDRIRADHDAVEPDDGTHDGTTDDEETPNA